MVFVSATMPEVMKEVEASWLLLGGYDQVIMKLQEDKIMGKFTYDKGVLRRKGKIVVGPSKELRVKLLNIYHGGVLGGHSVTQSTYKRIASIFYWPKLEKYIRQFVHGCDTYQCYKFESCATLGLLQPLSTPKECW